MRGGWKLALASFLVFGQTVAALLVATPSSHAASPLPTLIYVFAGQSNMVGTGTNAAELTRVDPTLNTPPHNVLFWGPTEDTPREWGSLQPPTEVRQAESHMGFGPEVAAAHGLAGRHPNATVAIVKLSRGATSLAASWNPRNPLGLYATLIGEVRAAKARLEMQTQGPARIAGFFWMQGESDAMFRTTANQYRANLTDFIAAVRRDLRAPTLPFVVGQIAELKADVGIQYCSIVRAAQRDVARQTPATYFVPTDGLERSNASRAHFSSRGTVDLGRRFVNATFPL